MFGCKLGKNNYELYPEEIQQQLRTMYARTITDATSQEMEYDMTGGWVYKLRLFCQAERALWEDNLQKHREPDFVGAQWKASSTDKVPPREFDKAVQYRPILKDPKTQTQTGNEEMARAQIRECEEVCSIVLGPMFWHACMS